MQADAGAMGGSRSEEFLHPTPVGEDTFVRSEGGYAANVEAFTTVAPELQPKLYYGQPGYARDGKPVVFFRSGQMDKERYSTFGVTALAQLDDASGLWPTSYALADPSEEAWERLGEIVRRAAAEAS